MKNEIYVYEEMISLEVEEVPQEIEELVEKEAFGSFEVNPDPDEDIYIPGTDEKIN